MIFQCGGVRRPNNEVVVTVKYVPIYDVSRRVLYIKEIWIGKGRIVLKPENVSFVNMTAELQGVMNMLSPFNPSLDMLTDDGLKSVMSLNKFNCFDGPKMMDVSIPNEPNDVYMSGMGYSFVAEASRSPGDGLVAFEESTTLTQVGGVQYGFVGGAVNMPERQTFYENKTWRYTQSGTATGLFGTPLPPPAIWGYALTNPAFLTGSELSPKMQGDRPHMYSVRWSYEYEWHSRLTGSPHYML